MTTSIMVGKTDGGNQILINGIRRGAVLHNITLANNEAKRIHDEEMPAAKLYLMPEPNPALPTEPKTRKAKKLVTA